MDLSYTIQQVIANVCTKFQKFSCSSPHKSSMKKKITRNTHIDIHCCGKDKNYISSYTSYAGGIISSCGQGTKAVIQNHKSIHE